MKKNGYPVTTRSINSLLKRKSESPLDQIFALANNPLSPSTPMFAFLGYLVSKKHEHLLWRDNSLPKKANVCVFEITHFQQNMNVWLGEITHFQKTQTFDPIESGLSKNVKHLIQNESKDLLESKSSLKNDLSLPKNANIWSLLKTHYRYGSNVRSSSYLELILGQTFGFCFAFVLSWGCLTSFWVKRLTWEMVLFVEDALFGEDRKGEELGRFLV